MNNERIMELEIWGRVLPIKISYDCFEGEDGFIYVVYDHERYLCGDILMARFTEQDVIEGKIVSPGSHLQICISTSGGIGREGSAVKAD